MNIIENIGFRFILCGLVTLNFLLSLIFEVIHSDFFTYDSKIINYLYLYRFQEFHC